jgi:hypothetical protein
MTMKRMIAIAASAAVLAVTVASGGAQAPGAGKSMAAAMQVYKTPTCGCCGKWVEHVKTAGLTAEVHDMADVSPVKSKARVPADLQSCHTAFIAGYVVEGHVPADVIQKLLKEKPAVAGIAVPGMPIGSPGMEQGDRKDPYEVIAFTKDGKRSVYAKRP